MFGRIVERGTWLLVNVSVTLVVVLVALGLIAKAQDPCDPDTCPTSDEVACCNGDINGDDHIDIADPIALLSYLFDGGPAPAAIAGRPVFEHIAFRAHNDFVPLSSIASGGDLLLSLSTEDFDTSGAYDPTTGRFQPETPGVYAVTLHATFAAPLETQQVLSGVIWKNGAGSSPVGVTFVPVQGPVMNGPATIHVTALATLNGRNDFLEFHVHQSSPAATSASLVPSPHTTYIEAWRVAGIP